MCVSDEKRPNIFLGDFVLLILLIMLLVTWLKGQW